MGSKWRLTVLCEDRRTERFVVRLCDRYGVKTEVQIAPSGRGAASGWVRQQFPSYVAKSRSKNYQRHLGLLVVIDGDNVGVAQRKRELDAALIDAQRAVRAASEPVAIFVPTWSIETWLAELSGETGITEAATLRRRVPFNDESAPSAVMLKAAVDGWRQTSPANLPSLDDAYVEGARFGL